MLSILVSNVTIKRHRGLISSVLSFGWDGCLLKNLTVLQEEPNYSRIISDIQRKTKENQRKPKNIEDFGEDFREDFEGDFEGDFGGDSGKDFDARLRQDWFNQKWRFQPIKSNGNPFCVRKNESIWTWWVCEEENYLARDYWECHWDCPWKCV